MRLNRSSADKESIDETITVTNLLSRSKAQIVSWQRRCHEQAPSSPSTDDDTEAPCHQACADRQ